jgi:tetratricopeptide (TPR) repeat protein
MGILRNALCVVACAGSLAACQLPVYDPYPAPPRPTPDSSGQPSGETGDRSSEEPAEEQPQPQPVPPPVQPPPKQFRLGAASNALVNQARTQSASGNHAAAVGTLERALRIEPDNPLVWIELAKVHQAEGNHGRADGMARKALALATGDPRAQSAAWRVIAESLRARGRNQEAADAERRAGLG